MCSVHSDMLCRLVAEERRLHRGAQVGSSCAIRVVQAHSDAHTTTEPPSDTLLRMHPRCSVVHDCIAYQSLTGVCVRRFSSENATRRQSNSNSMILGTAHRYCTIIKDLLNQQ